MGEKISCYGKINIPYMAVVYKLTVRVMEHMKRLKEELYSYPRPLLPWQYKHIPYMAAVYKLTVRVMEHMKRLKEELYSYPRPLLPAQMAVARFLHKCI